MPGSVDGPLGPDWIHEIEHGGYRLIVAKKPRTPCFDD
jgi:hypothetical protein